MLKQYANLEIGQTHFRQAGQGDPVFALHASPLSSASLVPLVNALSNQANVIALDTPGYGQSDKLPASLLAESADLSPYSTWLLKVIDHFGFDKVALYGVATGAQVALDFAIRYPERLSYIIMDAAAHFDEEDRRKIPKQYFPAVTPQADGSHLQTVWKMSSGLFKWFPWFAEDAEHQISDAEPDPELVQTVAQGYVAAGSDYAEAYARAFQAEDAERIKLATQVPVHIVRWQGSIIKKYTDRFDQFEFPSNVVMRECGVTLDDRYELIKQIVTESGQVL